ncbi:MAG: DUF559 domain-containing protein [Deltaproteobacteria bacterium]|nr:DUF559 domain-containing protein [Deltaproteobacteria bacterium]
MKKNNIASCRSPRKNQTDAEKKLWAILQNRQLMGVKFRRQFSIGRHILVEDNIMKTRAVLAMQRY